MKKRAKKRLADAVKKDIAEKASKQPEQQKFSGSKKLPESRGFTARPDKKRG